MLLTQKAENTSNAQLSNQIHFQFLSKKPGKLVFKVSKFEFSDHKSILGNYFAKELGCPDFDMECMRSKTVKEITDATDRTPIIVNRLAF